MERKRDLRRVTVFATNGLPRSRLPRRRQRITTLRDSTDLKAEASRISPDVVSMLLSYCKLARKPPLQTRLTSAAYALASVFAHFSPAVPSYRRRKREIHSNRRKPNPRFEVDPNGKQQRRPWRRQPCKLSDKTHRLRKLLPRDEKMDMATVLEEAYKYIKFLQSQVSALQSMPCQSSAGNVAMNTVGGDLPKLNRQQMIKKIQRFVMLLETPMMKNKQNTKYRIRLKKMKLDPQIEEMGNYGKDLRLEDIIPDEDEERESFEDASEQ